MAIVPLKVSLNRYVVGNALHGLFGEAANPVSRFANLVNRSWNDLNGNYVPDCDLRSVEANGECGPMSDRRFGQPLPSVTYDEATLKGLIRKAVITGAFYPVLCGSAFKNKGVQPLLDAVVDYLPSPLDVPPVHGVDPRIGRRRLGAAAGQQHANDGQPERHSQQEEHDPTHYPRRLLCRL